MSGGGGGVIILRALIDTGLFTEEECKKLNEIADRSPVRVAYKDTEVVRKMLQKKLRAP